MRYSLTQIPQKIRDNAVELSEILRLLYIGKLSPALGRISTLQYNAICWPHFEETSVWLKLCNLIFKVSTYGEALALQPGYSANDLAGAATFLRHSIRAHVEQRLEGLLLPLDFKGVTQEYAQWYYNTHLRGTPYEQDPAHLELLQNPSNFTVYRPLEYKEVHPAVRVCLRPVEEQMAEADLLPSVHRAVLHAWHLATHRRETMYDPQEVGVDLAPNGFLAINWQRFQRSAYWPQDCRLPKPTPAESLASIPKRFSLNKGIMEPKLQARNDRFLLKRMPKNAATHSSGAFGRHVRQGLTDYVWYVVHCLGLSEVQEQSTATMPGVDLKLEPVTLIDPVFMYSRLNLFRGSNYRTARTYLEYRGLNASRRGPRQRSEYVAAPAKTFAVRKKKDHPKRVYGFLFKPSEWLGYYPELATAYPNHKEIIYAVHHQGKAWFTAPTLLSPKAVELGLLPAMELENWHGCLDLINLLTTYNPLTGEYSLAHLSYSQFFQAARQEELRPLVESVLAIPWQGFYALSRRERKKVQLVAAAGQGVAPSPDVDADRWYHDLSSAVAEEYRQSKKSTVRFEALVPSGNPQTPLEPRELTFFAPSAVQTFAKKNQIAWEKHQHVLRGQVSLAQQNVREDSVAHRFLTYAGASPLILAWTAFCQNWSEKSKEWPASFLCSLEPKHPSWSPLEDCTLLSGYSFKPKLPELWQATLDKLPNRTHEDALKRAQLIHREVRRFLKHSARCEKVSASNTQVDRELKARRLVLLFGLARHCRKYALPEPAERLATSRVLEMDDAFLRALPLPLKYRTPLFLELLQPD